ncbi:MAG: hypothetical protein ACM3W4_04890 [Ignavibacteriales bacterium]
MKFVPLVRFLLMLGGGMISTAGATWIIWLLGYADWPKGADVAIARIHGLSMLGGGAMVLCGIVLVALAWGKLDKLNVSVGGNAVELDFDEKG